MPWWGWLIAVVGAVVVVSVCLLIYWNNALRTVYYEYESEKLPESFDGFVIAHISDFHNKYYGKAAHRIVDRVAKEKPNIIVISGDIMQSRKNKNALALINALVTIAPVYYVSGNHESYVDTFEKFKDEIKNKGVTVLEDEYKLLKKGDGEIIISGVVDPRFYMKRGEEKEEIFAPHVKSVTVENKFNLLISHRPEFMKSYVDAGVDLVLSGHAHAGQVRFPFVGAIFTPGEKFHPHYIVGRYDEGGTTMIVSGGLGSSSAVPRVLNRPQLLFETLKKKY